VNKIADVFELDKTLIQKIKLKDLKLKAKRPKNCEYYLKLLKEELI